MANKRGDITSGTLIGIIILIFSVGIIIFFYTQVNWKGQVDDSICKESVILRGTLASMVNVKEVSSAVPLKCKTNKICIRGDKWFGKGTCAEEYNNSKEIQNVEVAELNDVNRYIAQEMVSCWQMMGEGKITLFSPSLANQFAASGIDSSCVICSRLAFDENSLADLNVSLKDLNVDQYMRTHKAPGQNVSYYDYLAGGNAMMSVEEDLSVDVVVNHENITNSSTISLENATARPIGKDEEIAVLFMQVSASKGTVVWKNTISAIGLAWGASFIANPVKTTTVTARTVANPAAWVIGVTLFGAQQINSWNNRNVAAGYCSDVAYGSSIREGCSVVRLVKYDFNDIGQYCGRIESIS